MVGLMGSVSSGVFERTGLRSIRTHWTSVHSNASDFGPSEWLGHRATWLLSYLVLLLPWNSVLLLLWNLVLLLLDNLWVLFLRQGSADYRYWHQLMLGALSMESNQLVKGASWFGNNRKHWKGLPFVANVFARLWGFHFNSWYVRCRNSQSAKLYCLSCKSVQYIYAQVKLSAPYSPMLTFKRNAFDIWVVLLQPSEGWR